MLDVINRARDPLVVRRERLSADQLSELAAVPDSLVPSLAAVAHETRLAWRGDAVEVEGILSAKTGGCPEDCHFCAQSARFDTPVLATPFLDTDQVLEAARKLRPSAPRSSASCWPSAGPMNESCVDSSSL